MYFQFTLINVRWKVSSCSVDRINCSLVIPVNRQRQSDGYQCHLFNVAVILSKWRRHQIIRGMDLGTLVVLLDLNIPPVTYICCCTAPTAALSESFRAFFSYDKISDTNFFFDIGVTVYPLSNMTVWMNDCLPFIQQFRACHKSYDVLCRSCPWKAYLETLQYFN